MASEKKTVGLTDSQASLEDDNEGAYPRQNAATVQLPKKTPRTQTISSNIEKRSAAPLVANKRLAGTHIVEKVGS